MVNAVQSVINVTFIDDDALSGEVLTHKLGEGFKVTHFTSADEALKHTTRLGAHVFVIDVHLGGADGFEAATKILSLAEHAHCPVLFTSFDVSFSTISRSLRGTYGDYIAKDARPEELRARIQRLVSKSDDTVVRMGGLEVDLKNLRASMNGQVLELTLKELKILNILLSRPLRCVHKNSLMQQLWSDVRVSDKTLNSHLSNLRQKIVPAGVGIHVDREGIIEIHLLDNKQKSDA